MLADYNGIGMTSQRTRDRLVDTLIAMGIQSPEVLNAIRRTPRHLFVDEALASRAYENTALPIGYGQTISQPYMVARMIEVLISDKSLDRVLEVGTGCGYQAVMLAQFARQVYTIERIYGLSKRAKRLFDQLGYSNIQSRHADGHIGWSLHSPFDGIVVAAAPTDVPRLLLGQLAINGRLIMPIGTSADQKLVLIKKTEQGFDRVCLEAVSFVPMLAGIEMK